MRLSAYWFICATCLVAAASPVRSGPFAEGQPFPDLLLPALEDGRPTSLADFRGQKIVLHVFASW
jgi:hypothetical protein